MQTAGPETEPDLLEVTLYFEGNSWLFSTFAHASLMHEALERAEKEFSIHSLYHQLGYRPFRATSAHVKRACDDHAFAKRNGKWQPAQHPIGEPAAPSRKGGSFSMDEISAGGVGAARAR